MKSIQSKKVLYRVGVNMQLFFFYRNLKSQNLILKFHHYNGQYSTRLFLEELEKIEGLSKKKRKKKKL